MPVANVKLCLASGPKNNCLQYRLEKLERSNLPIPGFLKMLRKPVSESEILRTISRVRWARPRWPGVRCSQKMHNQKQVIRLREGARASHRVQADAEDWVVCHDGRRGTPPRLARRCPPRRRIHRMRLRFSFDH